MRQATRTMLVVVALLALAGPAAAQVDTSKYVAVGDSLTAGYASGALAQLYQEHSFPAILAHQFDMPGTFQQPLVSNPGFGGAAGVGYLELKKLSVVGGSVVPTLTPKPGQGMPLNATLVGPYNNLGIPGAKTNDLLTKKGDIMRLATGQSTAATLMYDLVLRDNANEAYKQAIGAQGTFYTVWIGNNDVLGAALSGVALDGVTLTPKADFQTQYTTLLGAIRQMRPSAGIVVLNVPDVTTVPFVTTVKPYVFTPQGQKLYLIGEAGQLTDGDYLTLSASALIAQGYGLSPQKPLPEGSIDQTGLHAGVILRAAEVAAIKARTAEINGIIAAVAQGVGAKMFDFNALFTDIGAHGYIVGGIRLTSSFLTGGLFSYDGVHAQTLGYAVIANELVKFINEQFGSEIPEVQLRDYLLSAQSVTSVQAADTVFSLEAFESLLGVLVPEAKTAHLHPARVVRPQVNREIPEHDAMVEIATP
ncbi:MAG: SGNH/GDSL hydrolase family protein [Acidobacteriota bacterium]